MSINVFFFLKFVEVSHIEETLKLENLKGSYLDLESYGNSNKAIPSFVVQVSL